MPQSEVTGSPHEGRYVHNYVVQGAEVAVGQTHHRADFRGHLKVHLDPDFLAHFHSGARSHVPHVIDEHQSQGTGAGIGTITIRKDPDREPPPSTLTAATPGQPFPAVHEMPMNIHMTIPSRLPGITLRNKIPPNPGPAILRNANVTDFPPQGDLYQLVEPIELEDVNNPGPVLATILTFPVTVNPPTP